MINKLKQVKCKKTGQVLNVLMIHPRDSSFWIEGRNWWEPVDEFEFVV